MNRRFALAIVSALVAMVLPAAASAAPLPAWHLEMVATPTAFVPSSQSDYKLVATNVGAAPTSSTTTIEVTLPSGLSASSAGASGSSSEIKGTCTVAAHLVTCEFPEGLRSGAQVLMDITVAVEAPEGALLEPAASISGGGALMAASATAPTLVSSQTAPFGLLDFRAPSTDEEGLPPAAGSHPYQLTFSLPLPTTLPNPTNLDGTGHVRDVFGELPRGYLADPAATPVRCTEVELLSNAGCPLTSQIGIAEISTTLGGPDGYGLSQDAIYNMVSPPGSPASFGFNAIGLGIFVHLLSGVRSDGDYGLYGYNSDILAIGGHPVLGVQLQLWGDPSSAGHDQVRGECAKQGGSCPVSAQNLAFLTAPAACEASPPHFEARADSWEEPGVFAHKTYEVADLAGVPAPITGCNAEPFAPTISSQPTTNVADSPSGLEFDLEQPSDMNKEHVSPAPLKNARVTLPAGLVTNPSQADGLGACSEEEIGYLAEAPEPGLHFSKQAQSCPDAAKLGTVEVSSPLLAEYEDTEAGPGTKLATDPESGEAIPRPLHGAVYLARPYDNPFGSLLALYLAVEDPGSGIVAKLAGRVEPDPATGQLTTVFEESPELPLSEIKLSLFNGARASLTTPIACGSYATDTDLTPWSSPEGADAHPSDAFQVTAEPGGGACPASEAGAPNSPSFSAGTLNPQAGAYSPFVLKLSREDGSQRLTGIDTTLPPGLSGKLAGIAECSDAQIAQAKAREAPRLGIAERNSPSCPASSEVGTVHVAAGSGPNPFWTSGHAYLAGPYKGAPLSLAVIVPAVAGPFDLGTVVNRVALQVNQETAQIHAVSDPFPTILDGIPLDLRAVSLEMGRPQFTLNPTSCEPMSVLGTATSALGSVAPLSQPFQVGGCSSLSFKPKLKISLKGAVKRSGHPALKAVLTMPAGGANIARAQVGLPHGLFLDQGNLDKVCTQANLRAATCPPGSIYGHARAISPLLDAPLEGPVYLGVGYGHLLPDLVADLNGQIRVLLHGKVDTTKQDGIRNTFEVVPDAPVSRFELSMKGGAKYSLIENSEPLCAKPQKASALFVGQNGRVAHLNPKIAVDCPHGKKHRRHHKRRR